VAAFLDVAETARTGRAIWPRERPNKRLVVLLTALAIGGGSAYAAIPDVRDAIRSVFGATTPPSHAAPDVADQSDFGLGRLGEVLTLPSSDSGGRKADRPRKASKPTAGKGEKRRNGSDVGAVEQGAPPRAAAPAAPPQSGDGTPQQEQAPTPAGKPDGPDTTPADGPSAGAENPVPADPAPEAGGSPPPWAPAHGVRCKDAGLPPGSPGFRDCVHE
jgi:hypothetical protein